MQAVTKLYSGRFYHIFNRGNNRDDLFMGERDYRHFLALYSHHIAPVTHTFAYCLMRNHFHLLLKIKNEEELVSELSLKAEEIDLTALVTQHFSNFFNAYSKWFNIIHQRTGRLFEERFKRIEVTSERYFTTLIFYIHFNPQKHGFVDDFREWQWSSFSSLMSNQPTKLQCDNVLAWFGNRMGLDEFHRGVVDEKRIFELIREDLA